MVMLTEMCWGLLMVMLMDLLGLLGGDIDGDLLELFDGDVDRDGVGEELCRWCRC
jgi:hypothetical protein